MRSLPEARRILLGCIGACLAVHFWANDQAIELARGLRAAPDQTAIAKR
jgi:hypothetical protein